jgi:hypothetical protein
MYSIDGSNGSWLPPIPVASNPHTDVIPAMNTASATPDTLRQARLGLSRIRRMAIIVAASFGCFARDLARIATTQVPTTFTMAKPRKKTPKMMA